MTSISRLTGIRARMASARNATTSPLAGHNRSGPPPRPGPANQTPPCRLRRWRHDHAPAIFPPLAWSGSGRMNEPGNADSASRAKTYGDHDRGEHHDCTDEQDEANVTWPSGSLANGTVCSALPVLIPSAAKGVVTWPGSAAHRHHEQPACGGRPWAAGSLVPWLIIFTNSTPAGRGSASSSRPPCRHSRHSASG